jgi:hypothetical protein
LSASGSAHHTSGDSCPAIQRNYGICNNKEPENPKSLGQSVKDAAGGFGDFLAGSADAIEYATEPWCWFGADCGVQETYREKAKEAGVEVGSKEYKNTAGMAETFSILFGGFAALKVIIKKALKGGTKAPDAPKAAPPVPGPALYGAEAKQFGKKWGKHAKDYKLNPGDPAARKWFEGRIQEVRAAPDEVRQGPYNPTRGGGDDYWFYRKGDDLLLAKGDGQFVTMFPMSGPNHWFMNAAKR